MLGGTATHYSTSFVTTTFELAHTASRVSHITDIASVTAVATDLATVTDSLQPSIVTVTSTLTLIDALTVNRTVEYDTTSTLNMTNFATSLVEATSTATIFSFVTPTYTVSATTTVTETTIVDNSATEEVAKRSLTLPSITGVCGCAATASNAVTISSTRTRTQYQPTTITQVVTRYRAAITQQTVTEVITKVLSATTTIGTVFDATSITTAIISPAPIFVNATMTTVESSTMATSDMTSVSLFLETETVTLPADAIGYNGDFETGDYSGWTTYGDSTQITITSPGSRKSNDAASLSGGDNIVYLQKNLVLVPGVSYTLSFDYYLNVNPEALDYALLTGALTGTEYSDEQVDFDINYTSPGSEDSNDNGPGAWYTFANPQFVAKSTHYSLTIAMEAPTGASGVYLDNFHLLANIPSPPTAAPAAPVNVMGSNAGFETGNFPDWSLGGDLGQVSIITPGYNSEYAASLFGTDEEDSDPGCSMTVVLVPGLTYTFSFDYFLAVDQSTSSLSFSGDVVGQEHMDLPASSYLDYNSPGAVDGNGNQVGAWHTMTLPSFVAVSTHYGVSVDLEADASDTGIYLDNFQLVASASIFSTGAPTAVYTTTTVTSTAYVSVPTDALYPYGEFEDNTLSAWTTSGSVQTISPGFQSNTAVHLLGVNDGEGYMSIGVELVAGTEYTMSFDYSQDVGATCGDGNSASLSIELVTPNGDYDPVDQLIQLQTGSTPDSLGGIAGNWQTVVTNTFMATGTGGEYMIYIDFTAYGCTTGMQLDNIQVLASVPVPASSPTVYPSCTTLPDAPSTDTTLNVGGNNYDVRIYAGMAIIINAASYSNGAVLQTSLAECQNYMVVHLGGYGYAQYDSNTGYCTLYSSQTICETYQLLEGGANLYALTFVNN